MYFTWWTWNVSHTELACNMVMSQNSLRIQHGCPCCSHCRVCNTACFTIRLCSKFWQQVATSEISGCQCQCSHRIFLSTGIINDVICGMKDHESPELLAHVFFGGKKPEKRSFLQNPNRWWNPSVHGPSAQEFSKLVKSPKLKFWMSPLDPKESWTSWTSSILYGKKYMVGPAPLYVEIVEYTWYIDMTWHEDILNVHMVMKLEDFRYISWKLSCI